MANKYERRYRLLVDYIKRTERKQHALAERARAEGDMTIYGYYDNAGFALTRVLAYVDGLESND